MKPTVGRIVHFYTANPSEQSNNRGVGPYAAIIVGICGESDDPNQMVNLTVFADHAADFGVGSVFGLNTPGADAAKITEGHYWVWPPMAASVTTVSSAGGLTMTTTVGVGEDQLNSGTFLDRLQSERNELGDRLAKLEAFLGRGKSDDVSAVQWTLLCQQRSAMESYHQVLNARIQDLTSDDTAYEQTEQAGVADESQTG